MNSRTLPPPRARRAKTAAPLYALLLVSTVIALCASLPARVARAAVRQEVEATFHWQPVPGVTRYRLQVALDEGFTDIVYDGATNGLEQKVPLAPGTYYWRYAPAPKETGRFSAPARIDIPKTRAVSINTPTPTPRATITPRPTPTTPAATPRPTPVRVGPTPRATLTPARPSPTPVATPLVPKIMRPPANIGWLATVGAVGRVVSAGLRAGQPHDFVAVNSEGTVYALEGTTGVALWTARYVPGRSAARANAPANVVVFAPVAVPAPQGDVANVLVAFDGGVRLLEGETGRELWRAPLKGRPTGGYAGQFQAGVPQQIAVATDERQLYVLEPATGATFSQTQLDDEVIGTPIPFQNGAERGIALTIKGGQIEIREAGGKRLRGVKFDVPFVTPPLVFSTPRGTLVVVGSEHGLLFMDGSMKPLGRVTTEGESPRGRIATADMNGDGVFEIVAVTNHDRVIVVSAEGKIVWSTSGARDAFSAVFADLDGDGILDVITPDSGTLARGFSGRDGTLIWQAGDESTPGASTAAAGDQSRPLLLPAFVSAGGGMPALLAIGDPAHGALRAVGVVTRAKVSAK